jgi:hypothetical protein
MKTAIIIVGALALTGCTVERTIVQEATTVPAETTPITTPPKQYGGQGQREDTFIGFLVSTYDMPPILTDQALETGYGICDMADSGATATDFVALLVASGGTESEFIAGVIVGALTFLCPEHQFILDSLDSAV